MALEFVAVALTIAVTVLSSVPLGRYIHRVFTGERTWLDPVVLPLEGLTLRLIGVDAGASQAWPQYARSLVVSNLVMWTAAWSILTLQEYLPLNPDGIANMEPTLAFNTAVSFTTNTTCSTTAAKPACRISPRSSSSPSCSS